MWVLLSWSQTQFNGETWIPLFSFYISFVWKWLLPFQIIILNTNLYNPHDDLTVDEIDPCGQLSWFERQLQQAESQKYKVIS